MFETEKVERVSEPFLLIIESLPHNLCAHDGWHRTFQVSEYIERLVNLLKRDEVPISDADDDGWSHPTIETDGNAQGGDVETQAVAVATTQSMSASHAVRYDGEDEDGKIEEV